MRRPWRAAHLLIGLAVVAGVTAVPAAASAMAADSITIGTASSPAGNVGLLAVTAQADSDIDASSITAHLISGGNNDVLDVSDFALTAGTAQNGTWTVTTPIAEGQGTGQLPLGTYTVEVDATDAGGTSVTEQQATGSLNFVIEPTITLSASPTKVDYDDQTVTLSGTVTGLSPDGSTAPLQSQDLTLQDTASWTDATSTDSSGDFSVAVVHPDVQETYFATIAASGTVAAGTSNNLQITSQVDLVTLAAKISSSQVNYGTKVTITGTASYKGSSGSTALAGSTVQLYAGPPQDSNYVPYASATTSASGAFSMSFTATASETFTVYAGDLPNDTSYSDQLLSQATVNLPLNVAVPIQIDSFKASLSPFGVVSVSGCLKITNDSFPVPLPLKVEYSAKSTGPWTSLGTLGDSNFDGENCGTGTGGDGFTGHVNAKLAAAYYRLAYTATKNYQSATSAAVYAWKYPTRISSLKVSPRSVKKGQKITVSGRLQVDVKSWKDFGKKQVLIILKPKGSKSWYWIYKVTTSSSGYFSKKFVDPVTAHWSAEYLGDSTHLACAGPQYYVSVHGGSAVGRLAPAGLRWLGQIRAVALHRLVLPLAGTRLSA